MKEQKTADAAPAPPPVEAVHLPPPAAFDRVPFGVRAAAMGGIALATLAVILLVGARRWEIGTREWSWKYYALPTEWLFAMPALFLAGVMALAVVIALRRGLDRRKHEIAAFLVVFGLSAGIIWNLGGASPDFEYEPLRTVVAPWSGGYYAESVHVTDLPAYLRHYETIISQLRVDDPFRGHIADHPPGPVVFHWLVNRTLDHWRAAANALTPDTITQVADPPKTWWHKLRDTVALTGPLPGPLTPGQVAGVWGSALLFRLGFALALIPLYFLVRGVASKETALVAMALAALIPSLHLFGPYPDQLFPLFTLLALYGAYRGLRDGSLVWAAVSGAAVAMGLFWSLSLLAALALVGLYALLRAWHDWRQSDRAAARRWMRAVPAWAVGFLACALLPALIFGYDTFGVWHTCLSQHATFAQKFQRTYLLWTLFNPVEFAVFVGVPTFGLLLLAAAVDARRWLAERKTAPALLLWAPIAVLLALNLSGKNLGEVARLWMFLMPLAAAGAAGALVALDRRRGWIAGAVVALAAVQVVVFRLSLNVFTT